MLARKRAIVAELKAVVGVNVDIPLPDGKGTATDGTSPGDSGKKSTQYLFVNPATGKALTSISTITGMPMTSISQMLPRLRNKRPKG